MTSAPSRPIDDDLVPVSVSFPGGRARIVFTLGSLHILRETYEQAYPTWFGCPVSDPDAASLADYTRKTCGKAFLAHFGGSVSDSEILALLGISSMITNWPTFSKKKRNKPDLSIITLTAALTLGDPALGKLVHEKRVSEIRYHLQMKGRLVQLPFQVEVFQHNRPDPDIIAPSVAGGDLTGRIVLSLH